MKIKNTIIIITLILLSIQVFANVTIKDITTNIKGNELNINTNIVIDKNYHIGINRENAKKDDVLFPTQLTIKNGDRIIPTKNIFPEVKKIKLSFSPDPIFGFDGNISIKSKVNMSEIKSNSINVTIKYQACNDKSCFMPKEVSKTITIAKGSFKTENKNIFAGKEKTKGSLINDRLFKKNLLFQIIILFIAGVIVSFTPCIYPMIPVTIGYFASQTGGRKQTVFRAFLYILGIAITYSLFGVFAAYSGQALGHQLSSPMVNLFIAIIILLLALSMFGLYDIKPPNFISNKAEGRTGFFGSFIMGIIFGVVAAPCAAPPVIALATYVAKTGNPLLGFTLFFSFSIGLGTLLFLVAAFSANIPKPGAWMDTVKKLCGIILFYVAAYYLKITYEPLLLTLVITSGIFVIIKAIIKKEVNFYIMASILLIIIGYMVVPTVFNHSKQEINNPGLVFTNYSNAAFDKAIKENKTVMLDFTADWCVYCKKLEKGPFRDKALIDITSDMVLLKVDLTDDRNKENVAVQKKYKATGFPTLVFIKGNKSETIVGYTSSESIINTIKKINK